MAERTSDRRRNAGHVHPDPSRAHRGANPVLALQRSIGNRAVAQVLARDPVLTGTVEIAGLGAIKVKGGNLADWTTKETPEVVTVSSEKGKHSRKLEQLSNAGTKGDVKVTIAPAQQAGEQLNVGGGTVLDIKGARVKDYALADGEETWTLTGFTDVHRTKTTHRIS